MNVCFFNRSYWPDQAATGQLLTELAEDLVAAHGWRVQIVAGRPLHAAAEDGGGGRALNREVHHGVTVLRANGTRFAPRRFAGRAANYLTYCASAALASFGVARPDVVVSLTDPPIIGLVARETARRARCPFVFLCEDIFPEVAALLEDFHNGLVNRTLDRINRRLLRQAAAVVALGDRMRRRLVEEKGADPGRVRVIHNWADCEAIRPAPKDNAFSRAHGLVDRFVVMHSGNVGMSQNLDVLVDAADRLRHHDPIVFLIVGNGTRREALERAATARGLTNLRFLPYQPKAALIDSFAAADAFLVSLKPGIEGYIVPSKLYGILAAGRPFIAALDPSAEPAEIARRHQCGLVAAPGDADDLARQVLALSENPAEAAAMGARARLAALAFDRRVAVRAYHELLTEVAAGERKGHAQAGV